MKVNLKKINFSKLSFCVLFSLFFFVAPAFAEDEKPFTSTESFKMYTKNNIYLYEPCNVKEDDDEDEDDWMERILYTGDFDTIEKTILNASFSITTAKTEGIWVQQAGILEAIKTVASENLETYNPIAHNGYFNWSNEDWNNLKQFVKNSDSDKYLGPDNGNIKNGDELFNLLNSDSTSNTEDKKKIIATEFTYYYHKFKDRLNNLFDEDGGDSCSASSNRLEWSKCSGKKFMKLLGKDITIGDFDLESDASLYKTFSFSANGIKILLTESESLFSYKSQTLLIGDSLSSVANSNEFGRPIEDVIDSDNIDATYNRKFEEGYSRISAHGSNFKYLIYQLGNNNCRGAGCTGSPANVNFNKVIELAKEQFGENIHIFFVTAYRPVNERSYSDFVELPFNEEIRNLKNDKIGVIDWADELKKLNSTELQEYVTNDGHTKQKGAILLAKLYSDALSAAQTAAEDDADIAACNRKPGFTIEDPSSPEAPEDPSDPGTPEDPGSPTGPINIPIGSYYNQNDKKWEKIQWKGGVCPNCTIKKSGCPMIAVVNALYSQGYNINPQTAAKAMYDATNGFTKRLSKLFVNNNEWANLPEGIVPWYANRLGATIERIGASQINSKLSQGYSIVIHGKRKSGVTTDCYSSTKGECIFTKSGHVIAVVGAKDGKWLVANPGNGGNRAIAPSTVINSSYMTVTNVWAIKAK